MVSTVGPCTSRAVALIPEACRATENCCTVRCSSLNLLARRFFSCTAPFPNRQNLDRVQQHGLTIILHHWLLQAVLSNQLLVRFHSIIQLAAKCSSLTLLQQAINYIFNHITDAFHINIQPLVSVMAPASHTRVQHDAADLHL